MHIEFTLPGGGSGMAAQMAMGDLKKALSELTQQHNIDCEITNHSGRTVKVKLTRDSDYTVFLLVWQGLNCYRIVDES